MILPTIEVEVEKVARHYNESDEFYREVWGEHVHHGLWETGKESPEAAVVNLTHKVATHADIQPGMKVCDVGCGYGGTSRQLVSEYGAQVTGLTVSEAQYHYAIAQTPGQDNPQFRLCPWEDNDFESESFNVVVSIECISHVRDKAEFYRQIYRVLRPGGKAVVIAWLANAESGRMAQRHLLQPICTEGRLPGMATADEYRQMISDAGLTCDGYEEMGRKVRKTWWICARRMVWNLCTRLKYIKELFKRGGNREFVVTLFRILIAYHTGSMQYGLFQISKPPNSFTENAGQTSSENSLKAVPT